MFNQISIRLYISLQVTSLIRNLIMMSLTSQSLIGISYILLVQTEMERPQYLQTETQITRPWQGKKDKWIDRQVDKQTNRQRQREIRRQTDSQTNGQIDKEKQKRMDTYINTRRNTRKRSHAQMKKRKKYGKKKTQNLEEKWEKYHASQGDISTDRNISKIVSFGSHSTSERK